MDEIRLISHGDDYYYSQTATWGNSPPLDCYKNWFNHYQSVLNWYKLQPATWDNSPPLDCRQLFSLSPPAPAFFRLMSICKKISIMTWRFRDATKVKGSNLEGKTSFKYVFRQLSSNSLRCSSVFQTSKERWANAINHCFWRLLPDGAHDHAPVQW